MRMKKEDKDEVREKFTDEVNEVIEHNLLFLSLGNEAMKKRHWLKVFTLLSKQDPSINPRALDLANLTFQSLIE